MASSIWGPRTRRDDVDRNGFAAMLGNLAERVEKVDELGRKNGHHCDHPALQAMRDEHPDSHYQRLTQEQRERWIQGQRLRRQRERLRKQAKT
jgi:hypothetical protein